MCDSVVVYIVVINNNKNTMSSVAKTIFQMSIAELKSECELRDINSTGAKNDILIRLEQCILDDGYDPQTLQLPVSTTHPCSSAGIPPRTNNRRTGVPDYSVVESGDGYIDDEVRNICFNNDQCDRLSGAADNCGSNNSSRVNSRLSNRDAPPQNKHFSDTTQQLVDLSHQVGNAGAHVRREVELFSIENRLESIETALVDIKNSVRSLNARQDAIENRLKSHGCCGAIGHTRISPNRDSSNLAELNSRIAEIEHDLRGTATAPRRLSAAQPRPSVAFADPHARAYSSPSPPICDRTYVRRSNTTNNEPNFNANMGAEFRDRRNYGSTDHASSTRVGAAPRYSDRRSPQFYGMPNSDNVNTVLLNNETHYSDRCTGQPETFASTRNPAFSFNFKLTPPQFAGKKYEDPKNFIESCESVFRNSGVPPSEWVRLIQDQLSESAATWYKMVKSLGLSWNEFLIEFADRWDSPAIRSQLMAELMSVRQRPEQSLTDFCIYKYNLARRIELQLPEADIVEIVGSLARDEFISLVRLANPHTFRDLRRVAKQLDGPRRSVTAAPDQTAAKRSQLAVKPSGGPKDPHPPKKGVVCYECGGPHYANVCENRVDKAKSNDFNKERKSGNDRRADRKTDKSSRK